MENLINSTSSGDGGDGGSAVHIFMFPFLAFGHIIPFVQLSRKLLSAGTDVRITFLSAAGNVPRITTLLPTSPFFSVAPLNLPAVPGLPSGAESTNAVSADGAELLKVALDLTKPQVADLLGSHRPDIVVTDFATPWLPALAASFGIKTLPFSVFSAINMAYLTVPARRPSGCPAPTIDDLMKPPTGFPAASPLRSIPRYQAADFSYLFKSFYGRPSVFDSAAEVNGASDAMVVKTCAEMEGPYVEYLEAQYGKPVLLVGPIVPDEPPSGGGGGEELEPRWAEWLGRFAPGSVVFCSFGSETFLADSAVEELLFGLEAAGSPFLVVLNFPKGGGGGQKTPIPEGFEERVRGRGVVHTGGWVQQQLLLRHPSVGCFVCHAGLSSVLEAIVAGPQLVMLPQKGDQFLNAKLFAAEMGVGFEVERRPEDGWFGRDAVCAAIKAAMEAAAPAASQQSRVGESHRKWREFLLDEQVQGKFTVEFIDKLRQLCGK
ncbi:Anthocyanidin 3-O-glucosyltransferase [Ananas comosus]|uniref:Glycosyltransferase n=1 Tax=Ananas comosus TaxID=4615 RepID=A0A199UH67_ANACO|nr:Anthocyanidin 3-O-glucosyltransferase [Ananas comosus]